MELKKNPKANVGRNSSLYFAVGLNVMLVLTYLGPDQLLEKESERIISLLPVMKLDKQRNKAVNMPYSIPINFQLRQH